MRLFRRRESEWQPGSYYSVREGQRYRVVKLLVVERAGVHVRIYQGEYGRRPESVDVGQLRLGKYTDPIAGIGIGHIPLHHRLFKSMDPQFVVTGSVQEDELDGYELWKANEEGYFESLPL